MSLKAKLSAAINRAKMGPGDPPSKKTGAELKKEGLKMKAEGQKLKAQGQTLKTQGQAQAQNYKKSTLLRSDSNALYTGNKGVKSLGNGKIVEKEYGLKSVDNKSGGANLDLHRETTVVDTTGYSKGKQNFPATTNTGSGRKKVSLSRDRVTNILN
jgi:hypothetical protein